MTTRIAQCFEAAASKNRAVLGVFVTAGDPDAQTSAALLDAAARVLHQIRLADVCVTLRIRRRHAFANAVVLGEVASLLGRTAVHTVIIILSLCTALAARLVVEVHRR